ncbi:MAG: hypothetical protein LBH90_04915 [Tannerella sp.]|jgi:hypothetical protein|nr:hypothetical protein [Tannerella sp.]
MNTIVNGLRLFRSVLLTAFCFSAGFYSLCAQITEKVYRSDPETDIQDIQQTNKLFVAIDHISFFKNNEFAGDFIKGYTLPGFQAQPKAVYYPLRAVKLEAGLHLLHFWGTEKYPNYAYRDIVEWKSNDYQQSFHLLPFFRVQAALSKNVTIVLGDIYGAANHRLIEPLYNPELSLLADPEVGLQLLYQSAYVDADAWVNWESFIFDMDTHQEAFTFGISSRIKYNRPESAVHFYTPLQFLTQHRGGEIDTILHNSVQTFMNGSIGLGVCWNPNHSIIKKMHAEVHLLGYYQQAGMLWPFNSGTGFYALASSGVKDFRLTAAYWQSNDFISMFGSPFYGAVSMLEEGGTFKKPQMITLGLEYVKKFGKGFALGADVNVYRHLSVNMSTPEGIEKRPGATSFTVGVYFRANPSFLIKAF